MLTPAAFVERYALIGANKGRMPLKKLLLLSVLAGFLIGMGGAVTNTAACTISNPSTAKLISGLLFPFGLIMVLFLGAELFTGNCLIVISVLEHRTGWSGMLRNLVLVYLGNALGATALAWACVYGGQLDFATGQLVVWTIRTAAAKCALPFGKAMILGVLCNILVCAGVVCGLSAEHACGRAIGAFVPVAFFVICGFEHCVANWYYVPAGLFACVRYPDLAAELNCATLTWSKFVCSNLLPVTLGNVLGGCGLGALLWCAHRET